MKAPANKMATHSVTQAYSPSGNGLQCPHPSHRCGLV